MKRSLTFLLISPIAGILSTAEAATLTLDGSPTFNVGAPNLTSTVTGGVIGGDLIKISGNAEFVQTEILVAELVMTFGGTFSAEEGDFFSMFYEFTGSVVSLATVTYSLEVDVTLDTPFGDLTLPNAVEEEGDFSPGTSVKTGMDSEEVPPEVFLFGSTATGSFTARLVMNTSVMAEGDTLSLEIPTNSIDLMVGPDVIPEPSGLVMAGLGMAGLGLRRRRRAV